MATPEVSRRQALTFASLLSAGIALSACSPTDDSSKDSTHPTEIRFSNAAATSSLDVAQSGTIETSRISAQILEPLVYANIDTGEPEPGLATGWQISDDRKTYTFTLREQVTFHDGSTFDAAAVIANADRWKKAAADDTSNAHISYLQLFSSLNSSDDATPLVTDYSAQENTVIFILSRPSVSFLKALTQPAFGIAAPSALDGNGHFTHLPVGTGAFLAKSWDGSTALLTRYPGYWGSAPQLESITFNTVPSAAKRYRAIVEDTTDIYDLVGTDHYVNLAKSGVLIQPRDPYSISYVSINMQNPLFKDIRMRQAVAYAFNRSEIVSNYYPRGTNVADDFLPSLFMVKDENVSKFYGHNTAKSKGLLEAAGYDNQEIEFYYPTDVSLATMMKPEAIYASLSADLVKAGFNIVPRPVKWSAGYLDHITSANETRGLALTGFVGSYRDPNAFYSRILAATSEVIASSSDSTAPAADEPAETENSPSPSASPATDPSVPTVTYEQILTKIRIADQLLDNDERKSAYTDINKLIAQLMPAVPIAYPVSSVALGTRVGYYPLSATGVSSFSNITIR